MMDMDMPPLPMGAPPPDEVEEDEEEIEFDPIARLKDAVPLVARTNGQVSYSLPDPMPRIEPMMIAPALADAWLKVNTLNRKIRDDFVAELTRTIQRGEWLFNGETFKFSIQDQMIDGQHRAWAILRSGIAVPGLVVFDMPPEAQDTIDTGRRRLVSDVLQMKGEVDSIALAAMLNRMYVWSYGDIALRQPTRFKLSAPQALAMLDMDPEVRDSLQFARRVHEWSERIIAKSMIGATYHRFRAIDKPDAEDFWRRFATGIDSPLGHPTQKLRMMMKRNASKRSQKLDTYTIHACVIKAWNCYRLGMTNIRQLSFRAGGKSPEAFPTPR